MRSKYVLLLVLLLSAASCDKSDQLDEAEKKYVLLNVALVKSRANSTDSAILKFRMDSVFKAFNSSEKEFLSQSKQLASTPDRSEIIFRAISDSLNKTPKP